MLLPRESKLIFRVVIHLDCFSYIDFSFWMGCLSFCSMLWDRFSPILCLHTTFSVWSVFSFLLPALTSSYSYAFVLIHIKHVTWSPRCLSGGWQDRKYPKEGRSNGVSWLTLVVALFTLQISLFAFAVAVCCVQEKKAAPGSPLAMRRALFLGGMLQS